MCDVRRGNSGAIVLGRARMDRAALTVGPAMDMPIMHDSDRYELVKDIGSGNFGVARLMRDKQTRDLVAVKYIERGEKVSPPSLYCFRKKVSFASASSLISFPFLAINAVVCFPYSLILCFLRSSDR